MGLRINTNVSALQATSSMKKNARATESMFSKLASGQRISKAADDAAGLAISEKLKGHIRSFQQADRNVNDGISMVQVAEGALGEMGNILVRLRELGIQAASDTIGNNERGYIDVEYQSLKEELERISNITDFNGTKLLNGEGGKIEIQAGIHNNPQEDRITYEAEKVDVTLGSLGIESLSADTKSDAQDSLSYIDGAISKLNSNRSELGAIQNRLTVSTNNLQTSIENMSAANSRIRDLDYAEATAENAKQQILNQATVSVLGQANVNKHSALKLLG